MSACPIPDQSENNSPPGPFNPDPPINVVENCAVGPVDTVIDPTSETMTVCCPGPAGPAGPQGVCGLGFTWKGDWTDGENYVAQLPPDVECLADAVQHNGSSFICTLMHTAGPDNEPGVGSSWEIHWDILALEGGSDLVDEDRESLDLFDELFDWIPDISEWGFFDWVKAIGTVAGIGYSATQMFGLFDNDGTDDGSGTFPGNADQRFTQYNGSGGFSPTTGGGGFGSGPYVQPTIKDALNSLCDYAGLTCDVTAMPNTPYSGSISNLTSARAAIQELSLVFQFDIVESGNTIKFIPKTQNSVKELFDKDLGFNVSNTGEAPTSFKRYQGIDLPRSVKLTYLSEAIDFNAYSQETQLQTFEEGQDVNLKVSMIIGDQQAKDITEQVLKNAHIEQMSYSYSVSYEQIALEPGDVITTPDGDVRIIEIVEKDTGIINLFCSDAHPNAISYETNQQPVQLPATQINVENQIVYSIPLYLDLPPLTTEDTDDMSRLHVAVSSASSEPCWRGANIYQSRDNEQTYQLVGSARHHSDTGGVITATPTPPNGVWQVFDDTTTIDVQMKHSDSELTSVTDQALFNDANQILIGKELIQFGVATLIPTIPEFVGKNHGNAYRLSHLLRGRQGTNFEIDKHVENETAVLINEKLVEIPLEKGDRGVPIHYKTVSYGSSLDVTQSQLVTTYGQNMVPWTVYNPGGSIDGSTGDFLVSWTQRDKYSGEALDDNRGPVKDKDWAGWAIGAVDDMTGEVVELTPGVPQVRQSITSNFRYTTAMQIEDFGSIQTCVTFRIYTMSRWVAGGYYIDTTIPCP